LPIKSKVAIEMIFDWAQLVFQASLAVAGWMILLHLLRRVGRESFWVVVRPLLVPWLISGGWVFYSYSAEVFIAYYSGSEGGRTWLGQDGAPTLTTVGILWCIFALGFLAPGILLIQKLRAHIWPAIVVVLCGVVVSVLVTRGTQADVVLQRVTDPELQQTQK
jgi:hypothetical protein